MYEELVNRLKHTASLYFALPTDGGDLSLTRMLSEAADAIEELQKIIEQYKLYLQDSIKDLKKSHTKEPKWIPVTERLPEKHQWCLVVGENLYDMDFINSRGVWTIHDKLYAPIDYWMPLPEPPKAEAPTGPYDLLYEEGGANTT